MLLELATDDTPLPESQRFNFYQLMTAFPMVGLVFDLSYVNSQLEEVADSHHIANYRKIPFTDFDTRYVLLHHFIRECENFIKINPHRQIAVCDMYGDGIAAYVICKFLEIVLSVPLSAAILLFEEARGVAINRDLKQVMLTEKIISRSELNELAETAEAKEMRDKLKINGHKTVFRSLPKFPKFHRNQQQDLSIIPKPLVVERNARVHANCDEWDLKAWHEVPKYGTPINHFVPFKLPITRAVCWPDMIIEEFSIDEVLTKYPKINLVINLDYSQTYDVDYCKSKYGVDCLQIRVLKETNFVPCHIYTMVKKSVDEFLQKSPDGSLIGVHCFTGTKQTAFAICRYLCEEGVFKNVKEAIAQFVKSRGADMPKKTQKRLSTIQSKFIKNRVSKLCPENGKKLSDDKQLSVTVEEKTQLCSTALHFVLTSEWPNLPDYGTPLGQFLPFKMPITKASACCPQILDKEFSIDDILTKYPHIRLVINLSETEPYDVRRMKYNVEYRFCTMSVKKKKVKPGVYLRFKNFVDEVLAKSPKQSLIGVHCQDGTNQTGYVICRYLCESGFFKTVQEAIIEFGKARGAEIPLETKCKLINAQSAIFESRLPKRVSTSSIPSTPQPIKPPACGPSLPSARDKQPKKALLPIFREDLNKWLNFPKYGKPVGETYFIPFKLPLKASFISSHLNLTKHDEFDIEELFKAYPKIGLIINLTRNLRSYQCNNVRYVNLPCLVTEITEKKYDEFREIYLKFQDKNPEKYVGVHCLTGDEQTKTMICKFLELDFGFSSNEADEVFNRARFPFKKS